MSGIYAIRDNVAGTIIGGLQLHPVDAPAVRFFVDVLGDPQSMLAKHPSDYDLLCLGYVDLETGTIEPAKTPGVILTGLAWAASRKEA